MIETSTLITSTRKCLWNEIEIFCHVWYWMWVGTWIDVTFLFDLRQLLHNIEFESIHYPILSIEVFFSVQHHDDQLMYLLFLKLTTSNWEKKFKVFFSWMMLEQMEEKKVIWGARKRLLNKSAKEDKSQIFVAFSTSWASCKMKSYPWEIGPW